MIERLRRALFPAVLLLLLACWLGGGVAVDSTGIDEGLQLLALPVLAAAIIVLVHDFPGAGLQRWGIAVACAIAAVPLLQLLPLPAALWSLPPARAALAADLAHAGVAPLPDRWTLSPHATEAALWALLPAMAAFLAAVNLDATQRRRLLQAVIVLVVGNVAFAFFQAGLPEGSALRLYPQLGNGFGGLLVNTDHQATACIIGMVLALGLALEARLRVRRGEGGAHKPWWYAALAVGLLLMVPLSGSRAGMAIAFPALAATLLLAGALSPSRIGRSKRGIALAVAVALLALVGVRAALGWMAIDRVEELRHVVATTAFAIGKAQAPLGSGIGSFVPVFEQGAPPVLLRPEYVNHAHNEYVQWWLTAGWIGISVLALALGVLAVAGWRIATLRGRNAILAAACMVAIGAVLAHSWADFPLRTLTLMSTTAALAGVMLAALGDAEQRETSRRAARGRDSAAPPPA